MNDIPVVAAVIRDRSTEQYLLCQRAKDDRHAGRWEFPGGKIERGESAKDALMRELFEELELKVVNVGEKLFEARDQNSPYVVAFYEVEVRGTPKCNEHQAAGFFKLDELDLEQLAPSDRSFVESLLKKEGKKR